MCLAVVYLQVVCPLTVEALANLQVAVGFEDLGAPEPPLASR